MARPTRWNEIVDAAATLFRQKGFVATSLEDIAGEVGMYKGSLYHYIKSKEDLLTAVVREPADQILADVRDVAAQDVPSSEKVRLLTRSLLRVLEENFTAVRGLPRRGRRSSPFGRMGGDRPRLRADRRRHRRGRSEAWRVLPSARSAHHDARPDRLAALAHPVVPARR